MTKPAPISIDQLRRAAGRLPRVPLGHLPTPLEPMQRFSKLLGGPPIWIKRDDCTGLAFGGNKTRHNEFILGYALAQGAQAVVWGAGVQSNNCRQTAAACARLGLPCHLILSRANHSDEVQGNLLLDYLLGATVEIVDPPLGPELYELITAHADRLRAQGRKVFAWDNALCKPRAAVSYALCLAEIIEQMAAAGEQKIGAIYISSAGSTGAGLLLGRAVLGIDVPVCVRAPIRWGFDVVRDLAETANTAAALMDLPHRVAEQDIDFSEAYLGPGYGLASEAGIEATRLLARSEGIVLDPVYTAKALAALIDDVRKQRLAADDPIVFVHTGGTPALFAYRDATLQAAGTK